MYNVAKFSPSAYVDQVLSLQVPGYVGFAGGTVALSTYLSANPHFGGAGAASKLAQAIRDVVRGMPEQGFTQTAAFSRVFSGQGMPEDAVAAMAIIVKYVDKFRKIKELSSYFQQDDYLQAMVDGKCFGLDCIGFIGTYFASAGLTVGYKGGRPLDYANFFKPVRSLEDIVDRCIVMLTSGEHIQIIDKVTNREAGSITVNLCQSSSGGPQTNLNVTLRAGGGSFLPVETFRAALTGNTYKADFDADNAARVAAGTAARDYESFLRAKLTKSNVSFGYMDGAIFQLQRNGEPANPVGGSVYVGRMPSDLYVMSHDQGVPDVVSGA